MTKIYAPTKYSAVFQGYGLEQTKPSVLAWYQSMGMRGHNGWDFVMNRGTPVYWIGDGEGTVWKVCNDVNLGIGVTILCDGYRHRFWHGIQGSIKVQVGQKVATGDLLMLADSTGMSTGDHLHYDLAPVDANGNVLEGNNGYFGCIDPTPFYSPIFVKNISEQISILKKIIEAYKQIILLFKK